MPPSHEHVVQNQIRLALSRGGTRLFRNNTGALRDQNGRLVQFGLCKGSSDLIGWQTVVITPDMVGKKVACFVAIEIKDKGRATKEQNAFIQRVREAGGLAGVARSIDQAAAILAGMFHTVKETCRPGTSPAHSDGTSNQHASDGPQNP